MNNLMLEKNLDCVLFQLGNNCFDLYHIFNTSFSDIYAFKKILFQKVDETGDMVNVISEYQVTIFHDENIGDGFICTKVNLRSEYVS